MDGMYINLNEILEKEYGFDGKNLFQKDYIEIETIGKRNKFWFNIKGNKFMYKKATTSIYEAYGELIAMSIAKYLDLPCASYQLAKFDYSSDSDSGFKNSYGIITRNFLKEDERLVAIGEIISSVTSTYIRTSKSKEEEFNILGFDDETAVNKLNNIEDLWAILDIYFINRPDRNKIVKDIMNFLVELYFFDILTLQGDRHIWNFGIIINDKTGEVKPAPLFDNSNIFNLNIPKIIKQFIETIRSNKLSLPNKKEKIENSINNLMYHSTMQFCIGSDDFTNLPNLFKKRKQLDSLDYFLKISGKEYIDKCLGKIELLEQITIEKILEDIEVTFGFAFIYDLQLYLTTIFKLNLNKIKERIENNRGKGGIKHA